MVNGRDKEVGPPGPPILGGTRRVSSPPRIGGPGGADPLYSTPGRAAVRGAVEHPEERRQLDAVSHPNGDGFHPTPPGAHVHGPGKREVDLYVRTYTTLLQ